MYDYVIIGAGPAGCVLANRLTEAPSTRVLLLEAGGEDARREVHIPTAFSRLFRSAHDWNYTTQPQAHVGGRKMYWPSGKMLGGSSSLNAMIYMRGHRADYDGWAARGCTGWSYDEVLPYFKKAETNTRGASTYHGAGGPLRVADPRTPHPLSRAILRSFIEAGVPYNPDFNGAAQEGAGFNQVTQKGGRRCSAATAYLTPVRHRKNLTVHTGAHATRIEVEGRRATGVTYTRGNPARGGAEQTARAGAEVLLCAGAIGSPQLLLRSGIGPAEHLKRCGLGVKRALPGVGQNLQDHLLIGIAHRVEGTPTLARAGILSSLLRFALFKEGPLTSNVAEVCAFVRTRPDLPAPDMQFHGAPVLFTRHGLTPPDVEAISVGPNLLTPKSVGYVALRERDPAGPPLIQPHYFSDEKGEDLDVLVKGLRLARRVLAQRPLRPYVTTEHLPGVAAVSDAALRDYVRAYCQTLYHPVGTCKMGTGKEAVVDPALRVCGLDGLRVADASVMPRIPRGNTNAPTIMIAEKAADLIRQRQPARRLGARTA